MRNDSQREHGYAPKGKTPVFIKYHSWICWVKGIGCLNTQWFDRIPWLPVKNKKYGR